MQTITFRMDKQGGPKAQRTISMLYIDYDGREGKKSNVYTCMTGSLYCMAEIGTKL